MIVACARDPSASPGRGGAWCQRPCSALSRSRRPASSPCRQPGRTPLAPAAAPCRDRRRRPAAARVPARGTGGGRGGADAGALPRGLLLHARPLRAQLGQRGHAAARRARPCAPRGPLGAGAVGSTRGHRALPPGGRSAARRVPRRLDRLAAGEDRRAGRRAAGRRRRGRGTALRNSRLAGCVRCRAGLRYALPHRLPRPGMARGQRGGRRGAAPGRPAARHGQPRRDGGTVDRCRSRPPRPADRPDSPRRRPGEREAGGGRAGKLAEPAAALSRRGRPGMGGTGLPNLPGPVRLRDHHGARNPRAPGRGRLPGRCRLRAARPGTVGVGERRRAWRRGPLRRRAKRRGAHRAGRGDRHGRRVRWEAPLRGRTAAGGRRLPGVVADGRRRARRHRWRALQCGTVVVAAALARRHHGRARPAVVRGRPVLARGPKRGAAPHPVTAPVAGPPRGRGTRSRG